QYAELLSGFEQQLVVAEETQKSLQRAREERQQQRADAEQQRAEIENRRAEIERRSADQLHRIEELESQLAAAQELAAKLSERQEADRRTEASSARSNAIQTTEPKLQTGSDAGAFFGDVDRVEHDAPAEFDWASLRSGSSRGSQADRAS